MQTDVVRATPRIPLRDFGFFFAFVLTALIVWGTAKGGVYPLVGFVVGFIVVPIVDVIIGIDRKNLRRADEASLESRIFYRAILWAWVPFQLFLIGFGAWRLSTLDVAVGHQIAIIVSTGLGSGAVGITIAHELGHRRQFIDQLAAHILLGSVSYTHFLVEHNRGHHIHVATPKDPATARYGEWFWLFLPRTVVGQYVSAWRIENARVRRNGHRALHFSNVMIAYTLLPVVIAFGFYAWIGLAGVIFFFGQSAMAILLLESVNYVEHYGLRRREISPGVYEKVEPRHSWNASYIVSNWLLFGLQRHADHHANAGRRYQILRHLEDGPQLPTGYPLMIVLSFFPPLYFWVMNKRVRAAREEAGVPLALPN